MWMVLYDKQAGARRAGRAVTAGKLLHAKRPRLIPIFDRGRVARELNPPRSHFWELMWYALRDPGIRQKLQGLQSSVSESAGPSLLRARHRRLDVQRTAVARPGLTLLSRHRRRGIRKDSRAPQEEAWAYNADYAPAAQLVAIQRLRAQNFQIGTARVADLNPWSCSSSVAQEVALGLRAEDSPAMCSSDCIRPLVKVAF
jgi:hypothetical protein